MKQLNPVLARSLSRDILVADIVPEFYFIVDSPYCVQQEPRFTGKNLVRALENTLLGYYCIPNRLSLFAHNFSSFIRRQTRAVDRIIRTRGTFWKVAFEIDFWSFFWIYLISSLSEIWKHFIFPCFFPSNVLRLRAFTPQFSMNRLWNFNLWTSVSSPRYFAWLFRDLMSCMYIFAWYTLPGFWNFPIWIHRQKFSHYSWTSITILCAGKLWVSAYEIYILLTINLTRLWPASLPLAITRPGRESNLYLSFRRRACYLLAQMWRCRASYSSTVFIEESVDLVDRRNINRCR